MIRSLVVAGLLLFDAASASLDEVLDSGRVIGSVESPSERLWATAGIAPGAPPAFSFRSFDAGDRGRLSEVGLMTDDAGH